MLKVGDKVKWNDPCIEDYPSEEREEVLNRVFTIFEINGEVISMSDGYSEVEATENELEKVE